MEKSIKFNSGEEYTFDEAIDNRDGTFTLTNLKEVKPENRNKTGNAKRRHTI